MEYRVILTPEAEGGFTLLIPAFPEYVGFAETEDEALVLAAEGIAFELTRLREAGLPAPTEAGSPKVVRVAA